MGLRIYGNKNVGTKGKSAVSELSECLGEDSVLDRGGGGGNTVAGVTKAEWSPIFLETGSTNSNRRDFYI